MSLVSTLGKMAVGMIVAKGVSKMAGGSANSGGGLGGLLGSLTGGQQSGGLGGLLGSLTDGGQQSGGLGGLLGSLTGGGQQSGGGMGGLGNILGSLTGGQKNNQSNQGGLSDLIGGLTGQGQQGGGLGGILNQLGGQQNSSSNNNFGDLFNSALNGEEPEVTAEDERTAEIMLRAMISAAKSDGEFDAEEQAKITEHLGDISDEEAEFVRNELKAPVDVDALIASVPSGMEQQVYLMSLMAIDLDSKEEAIYLDKLAQGLNITHEMSNTIHEQLGAPQLYT